MGDAMHFHGTAEVCQECVKITEQYSLGLYKEKTLAEDQYTAPIVPKFIKIDDKDKDVEKKIVIQFFKCLFCTTLGYMTFGFFMNLARIRLYPEYISFLASVTLLLVNQVVIPEGDQDYKVTNLLIFLMGYSMCMNALMLMSRKVYQYEKMSKKHGQFKDENGQLVDQYLSPFQYYIDSKLKIKKSEKNEFLQFFQKVSKQKMLFEATQKREAVQTNWGLRILESLLFNVAIFGCIYMTGNNKPVTFIQVIAFQVFFTINVMFKTNEQMVMIKKQKEQMIEQLTKDYENNMVLFNNSMQNKDDDKMKQSILDQKIEQMKNCQRLLRLSFLTFQHTRHIAGSTSTIYIATVTLMGFFILCDNFNIIDYEFKKDILFMSIYITYMVFLSINVCWILKIKYQINKGYKRMIEITENEIEKPLENLISKYTELIQEKELLRYKLEQTQNKTQNDMQMMDMAGNQQREIEQFRELLLGLLSQLILQKALMEEDIKKHCERFLYVVKVRKKILWKCFGMLVVLILASVITD